LELFGQHTRDEASEHVEQVDGFCRHLDEVASDGKSNSRGMRLMIVSRKAAITAEAQSTELDTMSSTISNTLTGLKERSARSAESAATLSSSLLDSVSFFHLCIEGS